MPADADDFLDGEVAARRTSKSGKPAKKGAAGPGAGAGDNVDAYSVTAEELRQFVERFEQLVVEKADVGEQQKELLAELKGRGYSTKIFKQVVALRKRKPDDVAEDEAILTMYLTALGMER